MNPMPGSAKLTPTVSENPIDPAVASVRSGTEYPAEKPLTVTDTPVPFEPSKLPWWRNERMP